MALLTAPAGATANSGDDVRLDPPRGATQRLTVTIFNDEGSVAAEVLYATYREVPPETPETAADPLALCASTVAENHDARIIDAVRAGPAPYRVARSVDVPYAKLYAVCVYGGLADVPDVGRTPVSSVAVLGQRPKTGGGSASCPDRHDRRNPRPARTPLRHAHAHNDYKHRHPLFDALSHRFASVEADVWLTAGGQLAVGHDRDTLSYPQCTLQALYLDPLQALVQANGGHVYSASTAPVQLVVDVKVDARGPALAKLTIAKSYLALERLLRERYASMLSSWSGGVEHPGPVRVVVTGAIDRVLMNSLPQRYAAYEGGLAELGSGPQTGPTPFISANWAIEFEWTGNRAKRFAKRELLRDTVIQAHAHGQQVRFWHTPEPRSGGSSKSRATSRAYRREVWREERAAHVDWLNTATSARWKIFWSSPMACRAQACGSRGAVVSCLNGLCPPLPR